MSDYVVFEHDRLSAYKWDSDLTTYVESPFRLSDIRCRVQIADGVTLGEIFESVDKLPELKNFISAYSWCRAIDEFHHDARQPITKSSHEVELVQLVVSSYGELSEYKKEKHFDICTDFIGRDAAGERWSVSYSPMSNLAHLPVIIDEKFVVRKNYTEEVLTATKTFSILEFLDAIYWDISFHGSPTDNIEFLKELKESINEIEEGRVELVPLEDVMREFGIEEQEN